MTLVIVDNNHIYSDMLIDQFIYGGKGVSSFASIKEKGYINESKTAICFWRGELIDKDIFDIILKYMGAELYNVSVCKKNNVKISVDEVVCEYIEPLIDCLTENFIIMFSRGVIEADVLSINGKVRSITASYINPTTTKISSNLSNLASAFYAGTNKDVMMTFKLSSLHTSNISEQFNTYSCSDLTDFMPEKIKGE